jgi:HSP20 family protein
MMNDDRKRRRRSPFDDFFGDWEDEFSRMWERVQRLMERTLDERLFERPFVYGFTMRVGPDGRPRIQEFGSGRFGAREFDVVEPITDVMDRGDTVAVTLELPGVEKEEIDLRITDRSLVVNVDAPERKYRKEVELPVDVDPEDIKATFKNGVLDVTLRKRTEARAKGRRIEIE